MAIGKSDSVHYQNIADSIRRNLSGAEGGNAVYFPAEMAGGVNAVAEHNYQKGYTDGGGGAVSNSERLIKTVYGIEKNVSVNEAVDQAISDFNAIKLKLGNCGAVVSDIEPTENYSGKIVEVYDKGAEVGYSSGKEAGITEGFETGKQAGIAEGYNTGKAEGYNSGYQIGKVDGKNEGYTEGVEEGKAAKENELKGDFYGLFEAVGVELPCNPTINDSFDEIREGIADAIERKEKYLVLYWTAKDGEIGDPLVYEYRNIKTISAPVFATIGGEGLRGSCYRVELLAGCQFVYMYGGEALEIYDKLGTLSKDQLMNEYYVEVRNLYSDAEGESKISQDEQGFVWYVDNDVVYLCDYRGKSKDVILPESYNGREYRFWAGAMCGLRYERLYIPKSIKTFDGGFSRENLFSHKIRLVTDSIDEWFDKECQYSTNTPFLLGNNCYINVNGEDVTEITTPDGRSEINQYVFYNYKNLKKVTIGKDVTVIKTNAFANCTGLTDIVINGNLTSMGYAFVNCTSMTNVTVNGTLKATDNSYNFSASSKLTVESMLSIMNAFLDNTGSTQRTVYFGSTNLAKLTAEQKAIATNKNLKLA